MTQAHLLGSVLLLFYSGEVSAEKKREYFPPLKVKALDNKGASSNWLALESTAVKFGL